MSYLTSLSITTERAHPFPYDVSAIKFAKDVDVSAPVTFIIGDNGTGKSTLLETLALRLQFHIWMDLGMVKIVSRQPVR